MFESGSDHGFLARLVAAGALMAAVGCGSEGKSSPGSLSALGIDDGASAGQTTSALLTAESQTVLKLDTGARLTVPEGSVTKQLKVDLTRPADDKALPLLKVVQSQYKVASAPYVVTPHGSTFEKDLELSLPIAKGNPDRLVVAWLEDEYDKTWEIHGKARVAGNAAKVPVRHFSVYVLLEQMDEQVDEDEELDAGGGVRPDAAVPLTGTLQERVAMRLAECGLVSLPGKYDEEYGHMGKEDLCEADCLLAAPCTDFASEFCGSGGGISSELQACYTACETYPSVLCDTGFDGLRLASSCDGYTDCADGSDEADCPASAFLACEGYSGERVAASEQCNGYESCLDGSDEDGCPAGIHLVCADTGRRFHSSSACDGYEDCDDGSDEARCESFTCSDGAQQVPSRLVCDLYRDCSDGSDEEQGCLKLTCDPGADETGSGNPSDFSRPLNKRRQRR